MALHLEFDGDVIMTGAGLPVQETPYMVPNSLAQLTVGAVVTTITVSGTRNVLVTVRNVSTAGQIIRYGGSNVDFATPTGVQLYPGEEKTFAPIRDNGAAARIGVIADAAGALVDVFTFNTLV